MTSSATLGVGVGVGAGDGICLELEPEPKISKMGSSGNPGFFGVFRFSFVAFAVF